jgi:hypothetical protein
MRVAIVFSCTVFMACAQKDQRSTVSTSTAAVAAGSTTPAVQSEPVEKPWAPSPLPAPGDTTPQGFPTETALLRWVRRFPPDSFPDLSKPVRDTLVGRGCLIPTPGYRANVITGAFTAKDIVQWAVVCSVHDTSQILVLDAKNGVVLDSLGRSPDVNWIQSNVNSTWLFSRFISTVPMSRLNIVPIDTTGEDVLYYGAVLPKPIDHDGIDEAFLDKASETYYFAQRKWFMVSSSD